MALYRTISLSFWTDTKIADEFTPEDRYFYLYLFTNPHTNLAGCYEVGINQMSNETGYSKDSVERLLKRFSEIHKVAHYSNSTKEVLLVNWHKYNWTSSEKYRKPLEKEINGIKNPDFRKYLLDVFNGETDKRYGIDTICIDTPNTNTITITDTKVIDTYSKEIIEIMDYLNLKTGKRYTGKTKAHRDHIIARLKDGFTVTDFKTVIDNQVNAWGNDEKMKQYIRPETLFCGKFESYLNNVEDERQKRKREEQEINERQRKAIKDADIGIFDSV